MKFKLFVTSVFLQMVLLMSCSGNEHTGKYDFNGIYVENTCFDCGDIKKSAINNKKMFTFQIKNNNKNDIIIHDVDVSCDCVVIEDTPKLVKAESVCTVKGYLNLTNQKGKLSKLIFVNLGNDEVILLKIIGNIV